MNKIKFSKEIPIKNIRSLPTGLHCNFLICIKGEGNDLIAKQWKRKEPKEIQGNEILIYWER